MKQQAMPVEGRCDRRGLKGRFRGLAAFDLRGDRRAILVCVQHASPISSSLVSYMLGQSSRGKYGRGRPRTKRGSRQPPAGTPGRFNLGL